MDENSMITLVTIRNMCAWSGEDPDGRIMKDKNELCALSGEEPGTQVTKNTVSI